MLPRDDIGAAKAREERGGESKYKSAAVDRVPFIFTDVANVR